MVKARVFRLRGVGGRNARDQTAFCAFHSFLVEVQTNAATYMRRMHNNNLEIKIAGSSCRPQKSVQGHYLVVLLPSPVAGITQSVIFVSSEEDKNP